MVTDNIARQLSCSFGWFPADRASDDPIFMEFAAQGQNLFVASGDGGAYRTYRTLPRRQIRTTTIALMVHARAESAALAWRRGAGRVFWHWRVSAVSGTGRPIGLPAGRLALMRMLTTGVQGDQTAQTITVTYTDGTTSQHTRNFSNWFTPQNYPGELEAVATAYRDVSDGSMDNRIFNLYGIP